MEQIVETKNCKTCGSQFSVTDKDIEFYKKVSPQFGDKICSIPSPQQCPDCRMQQRILFRNFFSLYKRKCDATGKQILAAYHDEVPFPVYEMKEWRGDRRDGFDYGFDIDFSQDIFQQIKKLHDTVPRMNIMNIECENTEYCNMSARSKNCYLIGGNINNEDCCYGHIVWWSKDCFDCLYIYHCELCYQCVDCLESYKVHFGISIENCANSMFLINCTGCQDCFGCVGLHNKQYCIFNQQYTKEEYQAKIKTLVPKTQADIANIWKKLEELKSNEIVKFFHGYNCEDVTGDCIYNSKNIHSSYDIKQGENLKYCGTLDYFTNCHDCNYSGVACEFSYNCLSSYGYNNICSHNCLTDSKFMMYCDNCYYCQDCFGCVGLKHKQYCIFNKQYTKEQYEEIVPKIIEKMSVAGQWGEFFPNELSSFGYNEAIVSQYYPMSKEDALDKGYKRKDEDQKPYTGNVYQPQTIDYYADPQKQEEILSSILQCEKSQKPFRIIRKELDFYIKMGLPVPTKHPDIRHQERIQMKNPRKLRARKCDKCGVAMQTSYEPQRPEKVYCEKCYQQEI